MIIDNHLSIKSDSEFSEINIEDEKKAKAKVEEMCKKLLANLVIEDYKIL